MTDLFQTPADPGVIDPNTNYLETLVGESKKFKSVEDLAKGKAESDLYIKTILQQQDRLREDLLAAREEIQKGKAVEELIDLMKTQNQVATPPAANDHQNTPATTLDIDEVFAKKFQEAKAKEREEANSSAVLAKLKQTYGNKFTEVLSERAEQLGLSTEDINDLARKSPAAFFRTMGIEDKKSNVPGVAPPRSELRSDNFSPTTTNKDWNYYEQMRKENPTVYYNPKTQVEMHKEAIALGESFYS